MKLLSMSDDSLHETQVSMFLNFYCVCGGFLFFFNETYLENLFGLCVAYGLTPEVGYKQPMTPEMGDKQRMTPEFGDKSMEEEDCLWTKGTFNK